MQLQEVKGADVVRLWERDEARFCQRRHNPLSAFEIKQRIREVWKMLEAKEGDTCLDVGCGGGCFSVAMALAGGKVTAFDINEVYIKERVIPLAKENGVEIETYVCDALGKLPFEGRKFDWIIAVETLEHLKSPHGGIKKLNKLLKIDGRLIITIPNAQSFFWKLTKFVERHHFWKPKTDVAGRDMHKEFTKNEALCLVKDFQVVEYKNLFSSHLFVLIRAAARKAGGKEAKE